MPAAKRCNHQHRTADHERGSSDGAGEAFEVATDAPSQGLYGWGLQSAQIAFGDTSQDAARVAGCIAHQTLHFARKLAGFFLYPLKREVLRGQASDLFTK